MKKLLSRIEGKKFKSRKEAKDLKSTRYFTGKECPYFSFFKSDVEEEYDLYSNDDSSIFLKVFKEYFTFELFKDKNIL